ncbi:MAG TPA: LOG family protein [Pyrodictium delaneyi]|uniref:LOG family protein n=1 Tax=Pyrodictium delaneyi TaxID=1273541 RepID=A0A832ZSM4_9CREN|nr:LOG family protein [Pyrodictium delaneyi]
MPLQVVVAAYSGNAPEKLRQQAHRLVQGLRACRPGSVVLLGGYRGLMREVADAARDAGLPMVFVIPRGYEGDAYPEGSIVIRTGLDTRERSSILVRSGDVVVVLGGAIGTLFEVLIACSYKIPVFFLKGSGLQTDRFANCFKDGVVDDRIGRCIEYFDSVEELLKRLCGHRVRKSS